MINFTILNKSKTPALLLVHGLFASAGYWLPYLQILRDYKLIILDIDYCHISYVDAYVDKVLEIIDTEAGGVVDGVVSHSLGTLLATRLPEKARQSSFEICPVHSATRTNSEDFIEDISRRIGASITNDQIKAQLSLVDAVMVQNQANKVKGQFFYLPDADQYFSYAHQKSAKLFSGGHFDIENALVHMVGLT